MDTAGTVHRRSQSLNREARDAHGADDQRANPRRRDFRGMRQSPEPRSTRPRRSQVISISYQYSMNSGQWSDGGGKSGTGSPLVGKSRLIPWRMPPGAYPVSACLHGIRIIQVQRNDRRPPACGQPLDASAIFAPPEWRFHTCRRGSNNRTLCPL